MSSSHAVGTSRVPSFVGLLNPLVARLLGSGVRFGPNVLLTVRGRATGLPRTFPIALLEHDGRRYVQSPFGEVNWVRNLRAAGEAVLRTGHRAEPVSATELTPEEAAVVLRDALAPQLRSILGRLSVARYFDVRPDSSPEQYITEARRHPTFELRPMSPPVGGLDT